LADKRFRRLVSAARPAECLRAAWSARKLPWLIAQYRDRLPPMEKLKR
jgi:hypothetical protein